MTPGQSGRCSDLDILIGWARDTLGSPEFTALIIATFTTAVTALVGWVGLVVRRNILRQLDERELALLRQIASIAVTYVEQTYRDLDGPARLAKAQEAADALLASYGLRVTSEQLRAVIEAAVYTETTKGLVPLELAP
ncbi:MAG: hypothetical protein C0498_01265 [Anaerolinea sp.]|nr:hypothetical protein [Anaerolinea sp.]